MSQNVNVGYACINTQLSQAGVTTNRGMIKKTFEQRGLAYASQLALANVTNLLTILRWNHEHGFRFFRMSSDIFPWNSHYKLEQLPDFDAISAMLKQCGDFATKTGQRLTFHPGPFNKLCSPVEAVVANTVADLENHSHVFDVMGFEPSPYNKINIHVGATYGNKTLAAAAFCRNFDRLSEGCRRRLTVENDDKPSMFPTWDLYLLIHRAIGVPIVFDYHHHGFCPGGMSEEEAFHLAYETWGGVVPVTHYSESRSREVPLAKPQAHSDYILKLPTIYQTPVDVMVEAKMKEAAVLRVMETTHSPNRSNYLQLTF